MFEAHSINAEHKDLIHDVAYDFYGQRMATCSSDQFVKVWDQDEQEKWHCTGNWKAHSGSVWKVTWAHPEFGQVLATCSFDRTVAVWEEVVGDAGGTPADRTVGRHWVRRANLVDSRTSVTDVRFGPRWLGLLLAACSADGALRIYEAPDAMNLSQWTLQHEVSAGKLSLSCLSWNPSFSRLHPPMLAVGIDDASTSSGAKVLIFEYGEGSRRWSRTEALGSVQDAVHDVAFAPNPGRSRHLLAIATKDVRIVSLKPLQDNLATGLPNTGGTLSLGVVPSRFEVQVIAQFDDHSSTVWRVCWNVTGTILASSGDDGCVRLWKANYMDNWKCVGVLKGDGTQKIPMGLGVGAVSGSVGGPTGVMSTDSTPATGVSSVTGSSLVGSSVGMNQQGVTSTAAAPVAGILPSASNTTGQGQSASSGGGVSVAAGNAVLSSSTTQGTARSAHSGVSSLQGPFGPFGTGKWAPCPTVTRGRFTKTTWIGMEPPIAEAGVVGSMVGGVTEGVVVMGSGVNQSSSIRQQQRSSKRT
ncbi:nucleoporin SEH1 isoform X1 [Hetaerina americana]|uniref:nucleoporin SEH1 isoform X1 n=1 Tax=Hetaerina americana TaxID=62018 RepID=UPI003A7F3F7F